MTAGTPNTFSIRVPAGSLAATEAPKLLAWDIREEGGVLPSQTITPTEPR